MFSAGGVIEVQYEVFRDEVASELVWYKGITVGLELVSNSSLKVTIRFEDSDSFDECHETFIADNAGKLTQKGRNFPFRIPSQTTGLFATTSQPLEDSGCEPLQSMGQLLSKLSSMESRIQVLERSLTLQSISPLYMTVCSMLNKSLKKFRNAKHKLQSNGDETTSSTWKVTHSCTYSDFKVLLAYIQTLTQYLEVKGNNEDTTTSSHISISIPSFKTFCTLFGIADYNYRSLLSCHQCNRKGKITSFKCIGSVINNNDMPSLPSIICVGGNAKIWCDCNYFFAKENGHTLSTGGSACDYERLMTREAFNTQQGPLEGVSGSDLTITWSIDDSTEICRPIQEGTHFIGKLVITIPYVIFNDVKVARKVHKWLRPNRSLSDFSDSSSSSS